MPTAENFSDSVVGTCRRRPIASNLVSRAHSVFSGPSLSIFDCLTQPGRLLRLCSKYRWLSFFDAVLDALQRACTRAGLRGMLDLLAALWTVRCRQQWPKPLWMRHGRRREFERVGQLVPQQLTVQREFSVSCVPHRRVPPRSVMPPMPAHNGWRSGRGVITRATLAAVGFSAAVRRRSRRQAAVS
jgi:hypothetical protein